MKSVSNHLMSRPTVICLIAILVKVCTSADEINRNREKQDYCQYETFQPRCSKSEVIEMESATYGRMHIGRCITAGEVEEQKRLAGDDLKIVGCAADVLSIMDKKCSGKTECDVRLSDFAAENIKPCFPGLVMYLEVSYKCVSVVDDKRSCVVPVSKDPTNIIISSETQTNCGSKLQPWIVESPVGQRVSISLLDFDSSRSTENGEVRQLCNNRGVIVDKAARRNVSICANGMQRTTKLYQSKGNEIEIFTNPFEDGNNGPNIMLRFEAVGCSEIIPPEDTWLKRNGDTIQIGCYSNRQTWQLNCRDGKWVGVLGNCTQSLMSRDSAVGLEPEKSASISNEEQVLAIVAISGCTLAICLAIICVGAICLRRFYAQMKTKQHYKTLNCTINSSRSRFMTHPNSTSVLTGSDAYSTDALQNAATYSVFVGETSDGNETNVNQMRNNHVMAHSDFA